MRRLPTGKVRVWTEQHEDPGFGRRQRGSLAQSLRYQRQSCDPHYMASDGSGNQLCELHLHLEGSAGPETLRMLDPELSVEASSAPFRFSDFSGFIECFKFIALRLKRPEDYATVARQLVRDLAAQGVQYAEVTLSAGVLLWKGCEIAEYFDAVRAATTGGPVEIRWILDSARQFG